MTSFKKGSSLSISIDPCDEDVRRVICDPYLFEKVKEDHHPDIESVTGLPKALYVAGYVDGEIIGLSIFHPFIDGYKLHFMVLKAYRLYARDFLRSSLQKFPKPVYVEIPDLYRSVINFAIHEGFKYLLVKPESFHKHGKHYDKYLLVYP